MDQAESNVTAAERTGLLREISALEQELKEARDLCEERRYVPEFTEFGVVKIIQLFNDE